MLCGHSVLRPFSRRLLELVNRKARFTEVSDGQDTEGGRCILRGPAVGKIFLGGVRAH